MIVFALMLATAPSVAQPEVDAYEDIVVEGLRNPFRLTVTQLREAVDAYNLNRQALAPDAPLRFKVFRAGADPALAGLRFRLLADDGESIPLPLDSEGRFALPALDFAQRRFALQANRKVGSVRVRPDIFAPGSTDADRSMGEVRLLCIVAWALVRPTVSVVARGMIGAAGGLCESSRIGAFWTTERPIAAASVRNGPATIPVPVSFGGTAFRMPGYDKSIPNNARLIVTYR